MVGQREKSDSADMLLKSLIVADVDKACHDRGGLTPQVLSGGGLKE